MKYDLIASSDGLALMFVVVRPQQERGWTSSSARVVSKDGRVLLSPGVERGVVRVHATAGMGSVRVYIGAGASCSGFDEGGDEG